ncbi:MAG: PHB depolymerase family esterase, partial [Planctomycetota bacterium]|nr:PHB depolymerase family esterase [Planctomycetota bacterium]
MRKMVILLLFLTVLPTTVYAQQQPQTPEQKAEAFSQAFDAGMDAIRNKKYQQGIRAFKYCAALFPERPTAYYNLACIYSLLGKKEEALNHVETALKKGFKSFEHMTRDTDLKNIQGEKRFKDLVKTYKKKLVEQLQSRMIEPKGHDGKRPLFVFLHGRDQNPDQYVALMKDLAQKHGFGLILPRGDVNAAQGARWGQGAETSVMTPLKKALASGKYDSKKVVIGGFSSGAFQALDIALTNPGVFSGVVDFGAFYEESQVTASLPAAAKAGLRIFM